MSDRLCYAARDEDEDEKRLEVTYSAAALLRIACLSL